MQLTRYGEPVTFGHSGGVPGYQCDFEFDPERRVGLVVLRSAVGDDFDMGSVLASVFAAQK